MKTANGGERVLLVVAPIWPTRWPNLGVSQLKASLERAGHPTDVLYLNMLFASRVNLTNLERLGWYQAQMLGEFLFSAALFGEKAGGIDDYVNEILSGTDALHFIESEFPDESPATALARLRAEAVAFCDGEGLETILARDARLVGFSSTFEQNCASLALLERLKRERPDVVTVMGGANCEGEMGEELIARFPSVDYVGQGECEHSLVALVDALADGRSGDGIPGMLSRQSSSGALPVKPLTSAELDDLPYADFDDYFAQRTAYGPLREPVRGRRGLLMETSRGCWWGAKHHCTFCGLNGESMAFRSKSPGRVLDEIDRAVERYEPTVIRMADSILDMQFFKTVLPRLAEKRRVPLFYETKANLKREQVRMLAKARVDMIQPGIESLSDESLRLMRKGSTKMQNIQILRWGAEYGLGVQWNYLIGFPGERDDELADIAQEVESLHHLAPPARGVVLRVDRFSPYFTSADEFGLTPLTPNNSYRHVYPFPDESLARLAYFFKSDPLVQKAEGPSLQVLRRMVTRWNNNHGRSFLFAIPRRKSLIVVDTRRRARRWVHRLTGLRRTVYEECDRARSLADITRALGGDEASDSVKDAVESLVRDRLVLASAGRYLSLGVEPGQESKREDSPEVVVPAQRWRPRVRHLLEPYQTIRRIDRRLRQRRREVRDRWIRRLVFALVRLLGEPNARDDNLDISGSTESGAVSASPTNRP